MGRLLHMPAKGYKRNPMAEAKARNMPCFCGSYKKAKKCCGTKSYVKEMYAAGARKYVDAYHDLHFGYIVEQQKASAKRAEDEKKSKKQSSLNGKASCNPLIE